MAWPDANIEAAAERCLIYLIGTQDLGLHYERVADPKLFGCSDANWCTRQSRQSVVVGTLEKLVRGH